MESKSFVLFLCTAKQTEFGQRVIFMPGLPCAMFIVLGKKVLREIFPLRLFFSFILQPGKWLNKVIMGFDNNSVPTTVFCVRCTDGFEQDEEAFEFVKTKVESLLASSGVPVANNEGNVHCADIVCSAFRNNYLNNTHSQCSVCAS